MPLKPAPQIKKDLNPLGLKNYDEPAPLVPTGNPQVPQDKSQQQQQGSAQDANKAKDKPQSAVKTGPMGSLTLITMPEAEVFKGKTALGKTPLFRINLPVGTHMLKLKGADGKVRVLSAKIENGKTSAMKLSLGDLPEAQ